MKICSKCKENKPFLDFYSSKIEKSGYDSYCKICRKIVSKKQAILRKEKINIKNKEWLNNGGKEKRKIYYATWQKNKLKNDPFFRFKRNIRSLIKQKFKYKNSNKNTKTINILGADFNLIKEYFENKFKKGMTWENYGEWHIDHIKPLALAKNEQEVIQLNHYSNLQPLWAKDNLSKGCKYNISI